MERRAGLVAQQQLEQIKGDFYAMVTHDLRSPTSTIHLALQMLQEDGMVGTLNQEQQQIIEVITKATDSLNGLINDYLDFAQIDAGYLRLEWSISNLIPILQSSVHLAEMQAKAKSQTLILDCQNKLHAVVDAKRIKQVFDNLITNAIKYTPRRGKIKVQLYQQQNKIIFKVQDTGYGIPAQQLPSLFRKYHRLPGEATRAVRGSGLGLLIVKEIVEAHKGTVKAQSAGKGKGSTFTATIPLHTEIPNEHK
jgi:signal transduction histidine kinase